MKKVLWSIAAATLILTLAGCSNAATPTQLENHPLRPVLETVLEDAEPVENETVALSAGNDQLVDNATVKEDTESSAEPEAQAEPPAVSQPQEPQATVKASVTFALDNQKETAKPSTPNTPAQPPEPEPVPLPTPPAESEPTVEPAPPAASEAAEPAFSIDHWISYAQEYAKTVGLNLDYRYLANNALFESYIKIVKVDAETGKTIPYAGAGFQIFRPDGSKVTQTFTYPTSTTIDTFYTNSEGYLITPEPLEYGTGYYLVEVAAPLGYVLDSTPVYFDVTEDNAIKDDGLIMVVCIEYTTAVPAGAAPSNGSGN